MWKGLTPYQIEFYNENGYLLLESVFHSPELQPLIDELNGVVDKWACEYHKQGRLRETFAAEPFHSRLYRIHEAMDGDCPEVLRDISGKRKTAGMFHVMTLQPILDIIESMIGPEILVHPQFNSRAKLPDHQSVVSWHQDIGFLTTDVEDTFMVNFWLPLVDSNTENGCLKVIVGSHKHGVLPFNRGPEDLVKERIPEGEIVCCPVCAGGVLLIQHKTVHRSSPNRSGHIRWSVDIRYSDPRLPTGRENVPGFIARSSANPESVPRSHLDWLALFE